ESKEAILLDLLERHTQRLLAVIAQTEAKAQRENLDERAALHALVHGLLQEYETSATRHAALLNDTKFLSDTPDPALGTPSVSPRDLILNRQRDIVAALTRFLKRAYPQRLTLANQTALTMMLLGMINWTFTWLRPEGPMSYAQFANEVVAVMENGFKAP
ncbi:MAG: HTH-type transcriptional repressor KstR2, partial [Pseudomonadota bacterium]